MGPVEMIANMPAGPDMGITDFLTTSHGFPIENPDNLKKRKINLQKSGKTLWEKEMVMQPG